MTTKEAFRIVYDLALDNANIIDTIAFEALDIVEEWIENNNRLLEEEDE
jgi:hypothetical protein